MNKPPVESLINEIRSLTSRFPPRNNTVEADVDRESTDSPHPTIHDRTRTSLYRVAELVRLRRQFEPASRVDETTFEEVLASYSTETVYVHIGLKDLKRAFDRNPYEFIMSSLDNNFENILAAGFTPSFRTAEERVYHKSNSKPHFGAFARLFLEDADYRTNDATNSILVRGEYRFDDCDHHRSFAEDGCFGKLDADNVLYANIGTNRLVCSHLHYLEHVLDVPYLQTNTYEGTIYYDEHECETITQHSDVYTSPVVWNREKIEADLIREGILDRYELNGLCLRFFRSRELSEFIESKIDADPYYLVTL